MALWHILFWTIRPKSHVKDQIPHITEDGRHVTIQYYLDRNNSRYTPVNPPFEDVSPIETGGFPLLC